MRLLIFIVIAYVVYTLAKKILFSAQVPRKSGGNSPSDDGSVGNVEETVLDPVCDSYISKDRAVVATHENKQYFFCSEECRDKFTSE
ncbi:MAG: YHS domain-containing protein [Thermodesulfobacteriota bacterium]